MQRIKVKICGMREPLNISEIGELRPDYMGFIFYPGSKRFVGESFRIPKQLSRDIKRVGVFVNENSGRILQVARENQLDYVQLHGQESPEECTTLRANGIGVIKAFKIDPKFDFAVTSRYAGGVDFFLFDSGGPLPGGNGMPFDWTKLKSYRQEVPFFLAGGVSSAEIERINSLKEMRLHAIDVNSAVESSPGVKDKLLVKVLVNKLHAYAI